MDWTGDGTAVGPGRAEFEQPAWYVARLSAEKLGVFGNGTRAAWLSERIRVSDEKWRGRLGTVGGVAVRSLAAGP